MSVRVGVLTGRVEAAPGEVTAAQVALHNDGSTNATVHVRVVGLDDAAGAAGHTVTVAVPAGSEATCMVPVAVPDGLGIGEHTAGIEVRSDRPDQRPILSSFTVSIGSVERVELTAIPSTVRGLRRAKLRVDVANHEPVPVDLEMRAEAPDVRVRFKRPLLRVLPGQHELVTGRIKGPRMWVGEATQHNLVITGQGRASATTSSAVFVQRPLFARRLRGSLIGLLVVALWLAAVGGFAWWWRERSADDHTASGTAAVVREVDTDGDGVPDLFILEDGSEITGQDTDGDGVLDVFFDEQGNRVDDPRGGGAGSGSGGGGGSGDTASGDPGSGDGGGSGNQAGARAPTSAVVRGTVKAPGALDDIVVTLTPIALGGAPVNTDVTPSALRGGPGRSMALPSAVDTAADGPIAKRWPARAVPNNGPLDGRRSTEPIAPLVTNPAADGVWLFTDVALRQSYEVVFAKPGFDTQSFVVTPPDDGSAVELDVELQPARGSLAGRVSGPSGPLGGVELTITDGTLTFTTTSATVGNVGSWSLEQVSTPGVYTITGTRHGYGTEVRQVTLSPGQQFTGADLAMRPGVGSIAGRVVGPEGSPVGGITVTAASGDAVATTSTLTEGDIGYFLLPQLTVPGDYTVKVEADGFLTQTRRVRLGGAVSGVDFALVGTTLTLTGTVTSGTDGLGIPSTGLTLSTGDLTFKASTAGWPSPGNFRIEDLPPGNYTVRVDHYLHHSTTQFVTLVAGVAPPPLEVELEPSGGILPIGTGSLVVEVIDPAGETAAEREVQNATVRLVRTQTGEELPSVTQEAFNFQITNIPVGTYTLYVTANGYNPAPARQVSIGLSEERVQVDLIQLGQASGRVVDGLTGEPLDLPFFVSVYRDPGLPSDPPITTRPSSPGGLWQTEPNTLIPGTYRIEISDSASPLGYHVRSDQLLDENVVGATPADRFMRFVIPANSADPVVIADIRADRYPVLTGRVYRPHLNGAASPGVGLVPIDAPSLSVTVTCSDGAEPFTAPLSDLAGVVDGTKYDSFSITPEDVDNANLTGNCTFAAAADGFVSATAELKAVDASTGTTVSDRRVHLALAPSAPAIGGSVFWTDGPTRMPLGGVAIAANPAVSFPARESALDDAPPAVVQAPRATTSSTEAASLGEWDLDGQIFGVTDYTFGSTGFATGVVTVTVDDSGASATGSPTAQVTETPAGRFDVELSAPNPRDLTGTITVHTSSPPADLTGFTITASSPATPGPIPEAPTCPDAPDLAIVRDAPSIDASGIVVPYRICNAEPGTWTVTVTPPTGYVPAAGEAVATVTQLVGPGTTPAGGFDLELVELARVQVELLDSAGAPLDLSNLTPEALLAFVGATPGGVSTSIADHTVTISEVPVDVADPLGTPTAYRLALAMAGRDFPSAVIVSGPNGLAIDVAGEFEVAVVAGQTIQIELQVPAYGSISGAVVAVAAPWQAGVSQIDVQTPGGVTATRVRDAAGNPVTPATVPVIYTGSHTFSVSGPPGFYQIDVAHEFYLSPGHPDFGSRGGTTPATSAAYPGLYEMGNDSASPLGDFSLPPRPGVLDLTVVRSLIGSPDCTVAPTPSGCVDGATFELVPSNAAEGDATNPSGTITNGHALVTLYPNTSYQLILREHSGTDQVAFPVKVTFNLGFFTEGAANTVVVRAPLVSIVPSIAGTIVATGSAGAAPLPTAAAVYDLSITYPVPEVEVSAPASDPAPSTLVEVLSQHCQVTGSGATRSATCKATVDTTKAATHGEVIYRFDAVPVGTHDLVWNTTALSNLGYTPPATIPPIAVTDPNTTAPPLALTVKNVQVDVELVPDDQLLDLTAVTIDGAPALYTVQPPAPAPITTLRFTLAPRVTPYDLDVTAALHTQPADPAFDLAVPVLPGDAPTLAVTKHLDPALVRIAGNAQRCTSTCSDLSSEGKVELLSSATGPVLETLGGPLGSYVFDVAVGNYWVRVTDDDPSTTHVDYTTTTVAVTPTGLAGQAGKLAQQSPIRIDSHATVTVNVSNASTLTNPVVQLRPANGADEDRVGGTALAAEFSVPAGDYDVMLAADNYPETAIASGFTLTAGQSATWSVSPARRITLGVSGPGSNTPVVVNLFAGTPGITSGASPLMSSTITTGANKAFDIVIPYDTAANTPTWFDDDLVVQITAAGYRTQTAPATFALQRALGDFTLRGDVQVTGSVTVPGVAAADVDGGTLVARSLQFGSSTQYDSISGTVQNGVYSLSTRLGVYPDGSARSWVLTYERTGWGTATSGAIAVDTENTPASPSLAVTPRDINVHFQVNLPAPGGDADGATVSFNGTQQTVDEGVASFTIKENISGPWSYTAALNNLYHAGTVGPSGLPTSLADVSTTVTLGSRTVTVDTDGVTGVSFSACRVDGSNCTTVSIPGLTDTPGAATFSAPTQQGTYRITASKSGHMSAVDQFTVGTNGLPPVDASVEFLLPFAVTLSTGNVTGVSFSVCQVIDANTCNTVSGLGSFTATSFATPPTAGTYRVTATKSGYSSPTADFTIASGGATATIPLSFTLTSRTITVTVKRHNGNAVTNASFTRCDPDDCANTTATVTATQTGANTGVYTFVAPATAGDYQLTATGASPAGSGTASFSVVANGAPSTSTLAIDFPAPGP